MAQKTEVVFLTGASQGIGLATAQRLVAAGHRVVMTARKADQLIQAASRCHGPVPPLAIPMDVTDAGQVAAAVARAQEHFGPVSALINNAGVGLNGFLEDLDVDLFRQVMEVNYLGAITVLKACLPGLKETRGVVINVSSVVGYRGLPFMGGYCATKFALVGLGESIRPELKRHGVAVVDVAPGRTDTPFKQNLLGTTRERPQNRLMKNNGVAADTVAVAIERAMARRGPARVILTWQGKAIALAQRLFPRAVDWLAEKALPGLAGK